jgi:flagella basal body P-ring formation protein FlgA
MKVLVRNRIIKIFLALQFCFVPLSFAALSPELEQMVIRFVNKSPMVGGLRTEVEFLDPLANLQSCPEKLSISLQAGTRLWGRTNVVLRCDKLAWTYNLSIKVKVFGDYVVASRYLPSGLKVSKGDLNVVTGDLAELPDDVLRSIKDAIGRILNRPIQIGMKIGLNDLREESVISIGDPVRVIVSGPDFEVAGDGVAENAGMVGDTVRVKMRDGQTISGKVRAQGVIVVRTQ